METGRVLKAYNSFFYVATERGVLVCRLRGNLKRDRRGAGAVCPGDRVEVSRLPDGSGVVERSLERRNLLLRPAVANVDRVALIFAAAQPDPHPLLLNRFLALAEWSGVPSVLVCVNKMDLSPSVAPFRPYEEMYPVLRLSAREGCGLDVLRERLSDGITVFAGPSGAGKSSLLNAIAPGFALATGDISEKIRRGRHTTRVAELLPYGRGFLVDTPGFSAMDFQGMDPMELPDCFPDFRPYLGKCRFSPCTHSHEPDCAVKRAVAEGAILAERHEAYLSILNEITG